MKNILTVIAINLFVLGNLHGQDAVFSQFYTSALYLNPALSGLEEDIVLGLNYRSQWSGANLPFRTFQFSAIHPIILQGVRSKHLGGFGGSVFSDEAGPNREFTSQGFTVASSYNFHLNRSGKHIIATALQLGVTQRRINMDGLQWSSQYSAVLGYDGNLPGEQNLMSDRATNPVINAGAVWRLVIDDHFKPMKMFYQGFAVVNLNRPKAFLQDQQAPTAILYKLHGGYLKSFGNGFEISPNYLIQHQNTTQVNIGAYGAYALKQAISKPLSTAKVSVGLWYRLKDSFIVTTGFSTPAWNCGFSYDTNSKSLKRNFQGANAFEFSFAYRINIIKAYKKFSTPLI